MMFLSDIAHSCLHPPGLGLAASQLAFCRKLASGPKLGATPGCSAEPEKRGSDGLYPPGPGLQQGFCMAASHQPAPDPTRQPPNPPPPKASQLQWKLYVVASHPLGSWLVSSCYMIPTEAGMLRGVGEG